MSTRLLLVRHGQASIEAADYDALSPLGERQCQLLGAYLRDHAVRFDAVVHGSLRRHLQSWAALARGAGVGTAARSEPDFDEYDFREVLRAYASLRAADPELAHALQHGGRAWLKHLRPALTDWALARLELPLEQQHARFAARINAALARLAEASGPTLVVTSGGVIGAAVGQVMGLPPEEAVRLNLVIENSSVTELDVERGKLHLVRFNSVAHLADPALRSLV